MRDFSKDRLSVQPGRNFHGIDGEQLSGLRSPAPRDVTGDVLRPSEADDFAAQLAARWNTCADALARLGDRDACTFKPYTTLGELREILRRAVHGES